jgi:hypothetical protein
LATKLTGTVERGALGAGAIAGRSPQLGEGNEAMNLPKSPALELLPVNIKSSRIGSGDSH